ncbi:helix-turn-helix transcriptional regulator [Clostridium argentinense]|nr:AraC family transcriptional regulator [Clostridium argentinense]NFF40608.1 helix-turn-helix transcriptional regulator [Clostridium argentinense]NFP51153.1 helix-turn-helix transcriptional regulator [Clostridium argentinense]NFP73249.1 helix-turn-helix transcriptional regulator [Clostridium argentinense]NFP77770.1 helix-turn-helix transcriptional regulator [Clostridium argentinense]
MNSIKCERRIYDYKLNTHAHLYAQLILPIHGILYIETNYKKLALNDEHLFFLPPDCKHTFRANKSNEFLVLDISNNMLNKYDMENMIGGREFLFDDKWKAIRYLLLNEADNKKSSSSINDLFLYCYHFIADGSIPDSIKYINEHFTEDIDLKKLADIEHYNISYYSEWFKNKINVSPLEYIQNLRVKKAKELLLNTNLTILQISQIVGYEHNSSFTRVFKYLEKISPTEFRRKIKK